MRRRPRPAGDVRRARRLSNSRAATTWARARFLVCVHDMDVSARSKFSLCQFLLLFERDEIVLLLGKYGLPIEGLQSRWGGISPAAAIREAIIDATPVPLSELVQEIARTR